MLSKTELTFIIKAKAREIGFQKVGIARADRVDSEDRLKEWLFRGYHASMSWMGNPKRVDPRQLLNGTKSVIALALNYYTPQEHSHRTGKISRYAWGSDYHEIVKIKLLLLLKSIQESSPGIEGKCCVDTAPIMDKFWSVMAGIGWQGKHSNVITRDHGSWVFLGEILVNVELEYDQPIGDFCGTCELCIKACPTEAIAQPYVVDSRRCISYLTIENRDPTIPAELAKRFDNWIYGCDICQDVCPWNKKFSQTTDIKEFQPRSENTNQPLNLLAEMSEAEFRSRFRHSPVKRSKWKGLMRNIRAILP